MKRILFPTDFSNTARNAYQYAIDLAQCIGARIDLISVYHLPVSDASSVPAEYIERMLDEKRQEISKHMEDFLRDTPENVLGAIRIDYGVFISTEITEAAGDEAYDLIVMGTKGEHNAIEQLMGSVTTQTMMHAPCPVLAVPEGARFRTIEQIAYATDFQPTDKHAVEQLMELAGLLGARVHFVHVQKDNTLKAGELKMSTSYGDFADFNVVSSKQDEREALDQYLKEQQVDVLSLFIPRRRLWERLFHTSFSKRMTFHSKIPLLVFRA